MRFKLIALLFFTSLVTCFSQSVRASVESSEVFLGQPFEYRIIIEGTTNAEVPDLGNIEGITIQYKGASTSMVSSFGLGSNSSTKTITYSWMFTAEKKGTLFIPSIAIEVDGKVFKTASGSISVKTPEAVDGFHLFLETEKKSYWFGEPVNLTIKWLFSSSVSNPLFNLPFVNSGKFRVESQTPAPGNDVYKLNINGMEVLAMQSAEIYKGDQYSSLSFQLKLQPEESGDIVIEPVTLAFDSAERSNGFRSTYNSLVIPSNQLKIAIKDLPEQAYENGKPIILAKNHLILSSEANPLRVHIGDPLTYRVAVSGAINPEDVNVPLLKSIPGFSESFSIPDRRSPGKLEDDLVSFSQTIRVKSSSVKLIPEFNVKYFNIEKGTIEVATASSIPLEVLKTEIVTSANLEKLGYTTENNDKNELVTNDQGILFNFDRKKLISRNGNTKESVISSPFYMILLIIPFFAYLILIIFKYRINFYTLYENVISRRNSGFSKQYNSLISSENLRKEDAINSIKQFMLEYCGHQNESLTASELYNLYIQKDKNSEIAAALEEIFLYIDEAEFSREKIEIDPKSILTKFYALTMEFK